MAGLSLGGENAIKQPVESAAIASLRNIADGGQVDAHSLTQRHPRFKSRTTKPHFYVRFRISGCVHTEDASSLDALNAIIQRDYLNENS